MTGTHDVALGALVATIPTPAMPIWSPDGAALAYLWDDGAGWEPWSDSATRVYACQVAANAALGQIAWSTTGEIF